MDEELCEDCGLETALGVHITSGTYSCPIVGRVDEDGVWHPPQGTADQ